MTTITDVTDETFDVEVLDADGVVLVDFWAPWCRPCKQLEPILEELAGELDGLAKVVRIDTDTWPAVADAYDITSIPTLLVVANGEVVTSLVGSRPKAAIRDAVAAAGGRTTSSQEATA